MEPRLMEGLRGQIIRTMSGRDTGAQYACVRLTLSYVSFPTKSGALVLEIACRYAIGVLLDVCI